MVSKKAPRPVTKTKPASKSAAKKAVKAGVTRAKAKPAAKVVSRKAKPIKAKAVAARKPKPAPKPVRTAAKPVRPAVVAKPKAKKNTAAASPVKKAQKSIAAATRKTLAKVARTGKVLATKASKTSAKLVKTTPRIAKKSGPKSAQAIPSMHRPAKAEKAMKKTGRMDTEMPRTQTRAGEKTTARGKGSRAAASAAPPPIAAMPPEPKKVKFKADELRKLRSALEHERERLVRDIRALDDQALTDGLAETISQQPGFSLQLADSASDNQQVDTALGIRSIELDQLMQIDEALRAIEEGSYGICHRCGETISLERLLVKPMAKYCVPCRQLLEQGKA